MRNLLIVGSRGFIGKHMADYFAAISAYEVYGCDVVTDYAAANYFQIDVANADYQEIFQQVRFDFCIN
ncbi:MAG TPA: NAD-dependent epimerase/dehydratase family protein, partial [Puia sp.]|nr:NAD-dependent epimerase/dehydratase family protein [Puia sp.]